MTWWMAAAGAGLALGAAGSAHCALMCGPLVMAVESGPSDPSTRRAARGTRWRHRAAYHLGRVMTYTALGLLVGAGAEAIASRGLGRGLAIAAAISAVLFVLLPRAGAIGVPFVSRWTGRVVGWASRWLQTHPVAGRFAFGAASGLLPCGMVYAGLASAAAFGSVAAAGAFMAGLAVAPVPVLWAVAAATGRAGRLMPAPWGRRLAQLAPIGALVLAALLAFRAAPSRAAEPDAAPHAHIHHDSP